MLLRGYRESQLSNGKENGEEGHTTPNIIIIVIIIFIINNLKPLLFFFYSIAATRRLIQIGALVWEEGAFPFYDCHEPNSDWLPEASFWPRRKTPCIMHRGMSFPPHTQPSLSQSTLSWHPSPAAAPSSVLEREFDLCRHTAYLLKLMPQFPVSIPR